MNLTIVMPTFNRAELLRENLDSILKLGDSFELLVVDDGSNDKTEEIVQSFGDPRVSYYKHRSNKGYARSLNDGIERAQNSRIFICEDDAFIICSRFLEILLAEMCGNTIVATRLIAEGKEVRSNLVKRVQLFFAVPLAKEIVNYNGNERKNVDFCNNCFGFNRDEIETRFDESNYVGNVFRIESDFQIRARRRGARIIYNPELLINHKRHSSGGLRVPEPDRFLFQCMVNHMVFLRRHYSGWSIYAYLLLKFLVHPTKWRVIRKAIQHDWKTKQA